MKPAVIGVTGGIGSGKTRVAQELASRCRTTLIDLDQVCRQLLEPGAKGSKALEKEFADRFVDGQGRVDRQALREAIFSEPAIRKRVDRLIHPLARKALQAALDACESPLAVVEIPLLFEAGWSGEVDHVVVVWAPETVRILRVMNRDMVSAEQARAAVAAQMSLEAKVQQADHVVDNGGEWLDTVPQVKRLAELLLASVLR